MIPSSSSFFHPLQPPPQLPSLFVEAPRRVSGGPVRVYVCAFVVAAGPGPLGKARAGAWYGERALPGTRSEGSDVQHGQPRVPRLIRIKRRGCLTFKFSY